MIKLDSSRLSKMVPHMQINQCDTPYQPKKIEKNMIISVCMYVKLFSHIQLFAMLWTVACQAPLSTGFPKQEYWSGLPCPLKDFPDPGIKPTSLLSPALAAGSLPLAPPGKPHRCSKNI